MKKRKGRYPEEEDEGKYSYPSPPKEPTELTDPNDPTKKIEKEKPTFELSGKLSEEQRTTESGVLLKFVEPTDAKKPTKKWQLFPFKGDEALRRNFFRWSLILAAII